jgi:poly(A) polymerase
VSDPIEVLARLVDQPAWLVGGAVRDRLLGRATTDFDVAVAGSPRPVARALARAADAHRFALSEAFGAWRVIARDHSWQVDVTPLAGETIEEDLAQRDLTVNAIAQPLGEGELVDPFGGAADLEARRLRMVSAGAFERDPLRVMRVARLACELGFVADAASVSAAAANARGLAAVAPERVFMELKLIIASERAVNGVRLLSELGATGVVLPELEQLRGVAQSRFHHLDVYEHTLAVLDATIELERDPEAVFAQHAGAVAAVLDEPLANELTRGQGIRFGALFHDIAKPLTRAVSDVGRVTFLGHDAAGAEIAASALGRMRASERLAEFVGALARHHLRLGFLVHEAPLPRRSVYRYLKACSPVQVDVTVLSVADRLATRGAGSEEAIEKHIQLARQLMGEALAWNANPPRPPVRGDELAKAAGIRPGPEIGRVLAELEEASFAGEISGREQALARGRELLGADR